MSSTPAPTAEEKKSRRASLKNFKNVTKKLKDIFKSEATAASSSKAAPAATKEEVKPAAAAAESSTYVPHGSTDLLEVVNTRPSAAAPAATTTPAAAAEPEATTEPAKDAEVPATVTAILDRATMQQERTRKLFEKYGLTLSETDLLATPSAPISVKRVEKPIRMRVRRNCHRCNAVFGGLKVCPQCDHKRCKRCPRYPAKKPKDGAAGPADKEKKKATLPCQEPVIYTRGSRHFIKQINLMKYTCHQCETDFRPSTLSCEKCGHSRCAACPKSRARLIAPDETEEEVELLPAVKRVRRKTRQRVRWICEACQTTFIESSKQCSSCGHSRCEKCIRIPYVLPDY